MAEPIVQVAIVGGLATVCAAAVPILGSWLNRKTVPEAIVTAQTSAAEHNWTELIAYFTRISEELAHQKDIDDERWDRLWEMLSSRVQYERRDKKW